MNLIEELNKTACLEYKDDDGEAYKAILFPGLSNQELSDFEKTMPNQQLSLEIKKLLLYSKGFNFYGLEDICFTGLDEDDIRKWFPDLFHNGITLAGDGSGNYWFLHIDEQGTWKSVYYINHEICAVVKHSENLNQFIVHVREFGLFLKDSYLDLLHEKIYNILDKNDWKIPYENAINDSDKILVDFASLFTAEYYFCDLRNASLMSGFSFYKSEFITSHPRELIWAINPGKNIFQKIFTRLKFKT